MISAPSMDTPTALAASAISAGLPTSTGVTKPSFKIISVAFNTRSSLYSGNTIFLPNGFTWSFNF